MISREELETIINLNYKAGAAGTVVLIADKLALTEPDDYRRAELETAADIFRKVIDGYTKESNTLRNALNAAA